jgi:hypothetical protein
VPKIDLQTGAIKTVASNGPPPAILKPTRRLLPSWLLGYRDFTVDNEAPESYHLWVGLAVIAGAAQRKIYMKEKHREILSNLYVILAGPSGKTRKTTAIKIGEGFLREIPGIHFSTKAGSVAAMISQLAEIAKTDKDHQSMTVISHELGTFLSNDPVAAVDIMTDLFDGNPGWDKQTISRGVEQIPKPWVNLIAGTTPRWMGDNFSDTFVEGGFAARCLFVYEKDKSKLIPRQEETPESVILRKKLINDLKHINALKGEMHFTKAGGEFYDAWYMDEPARYPVVEDPRTVGYYDRKHVHVQRVAMLLSLAERDDLTVDVPDLKAALTLLKLIEPGMSKAFSAVGKNEYATDMERVLEQIRRAGDTGLPYAKIVSTNYAALGKGGVDQVLEQLAAMDAIKSRGGNRWVIMNGTGDGHD